MRKAEVYSNGELAGVLTEEAPGRYIFRYNEGYFADPGKPAVSLTLPKKQLEYQSTFLFPCFFNLLSEGVNRALQSRLWHIDEEDHFGLLLATAGYDTIGAVTVKPVPET